MNEYNIGDIVCIPNYNIEKAKIIEIIPYLDGKKAVNIKENVKYDYDYRVRVLKYFKNSMGRCAENHVYNEQWVLYPDAPGEYW